MLAAYGAPPLNPDHPIHSSPAPVSMSSMLLGGNLSRSLGSRGPTYTTTTPFPPNPLNKRPETKMPFTTFRKPQKQLYSLKAQPKQECLKKPSARGDQENQHCQVRCETYPVRGDEASDSRRDVDDIAPGVINDSPLPQEAASPEAEGADGVREGEPQGDEHHPRAEAHATKEGACEEDERDGGEEELEEHEVGHPIEPHHLVGLDSSVVVVVDGGGEIRLLEEELVTQGGAGFAPDGQQAVAEGHLVRPCHPAQQHGGERVQRHEGGVHRPLLLHNAAVENHQAWHGLQAHQRRRCHLPCVIALVQPVRRHAPRVLVPCGHHRRQRRQGSVRHRHFSDCRCNVESSSPTPQRHSRYAEGDI